MTDASPRQPAGSLSVPEECLATLRAHEELRLKPYDDLRPHVEVGPNTPLRGTLTIGYGHTGAHARRWEGITEAEADRILAEDVERLAADPVRRLVAVPIDPSEFGALVSFVFNVGEGAFAKSTLLRRLNASDYAGAAREFGRWVYSRGLRLGGLVKRRAAERAVFEGEFDWEVPAEPVPSGTPVDGEDLEMLAAELADMSDRLRTIAQELVSARIPAA